MTLKMRFVSLHEPHLPNGGRGLQFVQGPWTLAPTQPAHTFGDRARGDQHDFLAGLAKSRDLFRPAPNRRKIQTAPLVANQRAANLDHPAASANLRFAAQRRAPPSDS